MFLCEVGMNNTLVGLLHPQADEKMFNFSKCSAPSLSLFHFYSGYLWMCLRVFTCELRTREVLLICFFVFTVGLKHMLSIANKRQWSATWMNKLVKGAQYCSVNWYHCKSCVTLQAVCLQKKKSPCGTFFVQIATECTVNIRHYHSAISGNMQMCHKPTWWGQIASSTAGRVTHVSCSDWHSRLDSVHLVNSANYANHNRNDDDEGFKSYSKANLVLVRIR